jgi:hypothetical protein
MRLVKMAIVVAATTSMAFGPTAAKAASCQPGAPGCVLPLPGPATQAPMDTAPPVVDAGIPLEEGGGGIGALPFIIGLAALAAIAAFLLLDDEEDVLTP